MRRKMNMLSCQFELFDYETIFFRFGSLADIKPTSIESPLYPPKADIIHLWIVMGSPKQILIYYQGLREGKAAAEGDC